jgi:P4 family phage/plasmid primase-like protien
MKKHLNKWILVCIIKHNKTQAKMNNFAEMNRSQLWKLVKGYPEHGMTWRKSSKAVMLEFLLNQQQEVEEPEVEEVEQPLETKAIEAVEEPNVIYNKNENNNEINIPEFKMPVEKIDELKLIERCDVKKLAYLIDNSAIIKEELVKTNRWWEEGDRTPISLLRAYYHKLSNGQCEVKYSQRSSGRLYAEKALSLQSLPREFRHTIAGDFYNDLDMVNAHPVILQHLCQLNDIKCPKLDQYVAHRDIILNQLGNRDSAKQFILKLTNGGGKSKEIKDKWLDEYGQEMSRIHSKFAESNPDDFNLSKKNRILKGKNYNHEASYMNILLCRYENALLMSLVKYLGNPREAVLCFDGIMIPKHVNIDIKTMEQHLLRQFGIKMSLKIKEMDSGFDIPDPNQVQGKLNPHILKLLRSPHTDEDYAECFVKLYDNLKWYNQKIYQFSPKKHRWVSDDDSLIYEFLGKRMYTDLRKVLDIEYHSIEKAKQHAEIAKSMLRLRNRSGRSGIVESIKPKISIKQDIWDSNPDLIGFENGVYDLKQHKFRDGVPEDFVSFSVGYDYTPRDEKEIAELTPFINQILSDPQVRDYLLKALSTALWGKTIQKFFILTGEGSNGKDTLISKLFAKTLGDDYFYDADNIIITDKRRGGGPNVGLAKMHKKRFVLFSEPDRKSTLQGGIIKQFTGADRINARDLYSSNTITLLQLTTFCLCNDIPEVDHIDGGVARRLEVIPFDSLFKTPEEILGYQNTDNIYEINSYYDSDEFRDRHKMTLFHILLDYLKVFQSEGLVMRNAPQRVKDLSSGYLEDCDDFLGWFKEEYQRGDSGSYIQISKIYENFRFSTYYMNLNKKDRRQNNKSRFIERIRRHPSLRGYFKEIHQFRENGTKKCVRSVLVGYKVKQASGDEPLDQDVEGAFKRLGISGVTE